LWNNSEIFSWLDQEFVDEYQDIENDERGISNSSAISDFSGPSLRDFDRLGGCFDPACVGLWTSSRPVILVAVILEPSKPVRAIQLHIIIDLCNIE
jgi:hypothetical protein